MMTSTLFDTLLEAIVSSERITIFRHEHPDCDALGSQWGLLTWIKENFPEKEVYALGFESTNQCSFPASHDISDDVIRHSTAIVLDTANTARIDDARALNAQRLIKVDHHPNREPYGDPCIVMDKAAATCEILSDFFNAYSDTYTVSSEAAEYLYRGLLTDTLCYRTNNTTAHTLVAGAYLVSKGIDVAKVNRELFDVPYAVFAFQNALRTKTACKDGIATCILTQDDLQQWHITASEARNYIDELGHVKEFEVWAIFTESEEHPGLFHGSLRSKHVIINEIAQQFNGGGHPNASGVKNLSKADINALLRVLHEAVEKTIS